MAKIGAILSAITGQSHYVNTITNSFLVVKAALMDVSHTGDGMSLSPGHLTTLYSRLPWWQGRDRDSGDGYAHTNLRH